MRLASSVFAVLAVSLAAAAWGQSRKVEQMARSARIKT